MSPLTSGRLSHSSGPLNGGSLTETDSPPVSPSDEFDDVVKVKNKIWNVGDNDSVFLCFWQPFVRHSAL